MYQAPIADMQFLIDEVLQAGECLDALPRFAGLGVGPELTQALLDEAGRFAADVVAPLRRVGDSQPAVCSERRVTASPGYNAAIQQLGAAGWIGICADSEWGGQGLPEVYGTATVEMWNSADMALALEPFLSAGAALAINAHGSDALKQTYLQKMHSGEWSGTMNLTESGAGSDLGPMKTRAERRSDHYLIFGQKIFITWGDHDATDNIVHLVLARLPDAPAGSKGISLFLVPKFLVNADGSLGERNDVYPVSVEHKLGIHGSPTCVMAFGDDGGAVGYLVGEENNGLACMFTMMNEARLKVGLQGLGASEGAYQHALAYARERVQGGVPIIQHADVKRMLMTMRSCNEAMRALAYSEALTMDLAHYGDVDVRSQAKRRIDFMIPIIKGWLTEMGVEITSLGIQVHGGMGYVEETGAAQFLRDVRITGIYEGTNGIQAADLLGRKLARDAGATWQEIRADIDADLERWCSGDDEVLRGLAAALAPVLADHGRSTDLLLAQWQDNRFDAQAGAFDYMMQTGYLLGGWQLARGAAVAQSALRSGSGRVFYTEKLQTAAFYLARILPRAQAHGAALRGDVSMLAQFDLSA